jgi:hypothetical protein
VACLIDEKGGSGIFYMAAKGRFQLQTLCVVGVAFQIAFRVKIYVNDIFLFFKNYF